MSVKRKPSVRAQLRGAVAVALFITWGLAVFAGLLLWLAPEGRASGRLPLLFGVTKRGWGELHFWFSLLALAVTAAHITIDWKALKGCVRYLTSTSRNPNALKGDP